MRACFGTGARPWRENRIIKVTSGFLFPPPPSACAQPRRQGPLARHEELIRVRVPPAHFFISFFIFNISANGLFQARVVSRCRRRFGQQADSTNRTRLPNPLPDSKAQKARSSVFCCWFVVPFVGNPRSFPLFLRSMLKELRPVGRRAGSVRKGLLAGIPVQARHHNTSTKKQRQGGLGRLRSRDRRSMTPSRMQLGLQGGEGLGQGRGRAGAGKVGKRTLQMPAADRDGGLASVRVHRRDGPGAAGLAATGWR